MFFKYPYTNLYNLNLDWIIQAIKELQSVVEPLDRVVNSVNGMTGDVEITKTVLTQILGNMVETFNGRSGAVELTAEDVNATLIDIVWTSDPGETIRDLTQSELDEMYASGKRILIFVSNIGVADQVYFLQWYDSHAQPQEYTPTSALAGVVSFNGMTGNVVATGDDIAVSATDTDTIAESLAEKVPATRAVNGQTLSSNVNLDADDIPSQAIQGATTVEIGLLNLQNSKVPNIRTVNRKQLLNDIVLNDEDIPSTVDEKTNVQEVLETHSEEIAEIDAEMQDKADVIISEASGAAASFDDGADGLPVQSLTVDIEPVQEGTGDPSPDNVRPITGWTGAKVTRTGKNLIKTVGITYAPPDETEFDKSTKRKFSPNTYCYGITNTNYYSINTITEIAVDDGIINFTSGAGGYGVGIPLVGLKTGETYRISGILENAEFRIAGYKEDGAWINISISKDIFTLPSDVVYTVIIITSLTINTPSRVYKIQLEYSSTATAYEPYQGQTYDITFPTEAGTVYGGTLDVTSGVLTADKALIASYNGETLPGEWISDRDVYAPGTAPTTGAQVVYELAEPVTYTLTPTEITALLGVNNIWADTGDVSVSYRADTKQYIDQKNDDQSRQIDTLLDLTTATFTIGNGITVNLFKFKNGIVVANCYSSATWQNGDIGTIPMGFIPPNPVACPCDARDNLEGHYVCEVLFSNNGQAYFYVNGGTLTNPPTGPVIFNMVYPTNE